MKPPGHHQDAVPLIRPAQLALLSLLWLLPLFPPETRGESMAGCASLIGLLALLTWRRTVGRWEPVALPLVLAVAWPVSLAAVAPGATVEPLAVVLLGVAAGLYVSSLPVAVRRGAWVPLALAGAGAGVSLRALYQKWWGLEALAAQVASEPALPDQAAMLVRLQEGRAFAAFATPAGLGGFLALALPVTLGAAVSRRGWARGLLVALALIEAGGLLAAASASAIAALLGALLLWVLIWRRRSRVVWAAAGLALLALVAVVAMRGDRLWNPSDPRSPWRLRAGNFRVAGSMFLDQPWLGVGPGGFGEMYPLYRRPAYNEAQHAHNLPLELAAETGAAGFLALSALFFYLFLGPVARRHQRDPPWVHGVSLGLAAFALHNLADFTAFFPSLLWLAALLRGVVSRTEGPPVIPAPGGAARLLAATALAGTLAAALVGGLSGIASNRRLDARQAAFAGQGTAVRKLAERATRLAPWEVDGWLLRAQAVLDDPAPYEPPEARLGLALEYAERAVRLSPVRPRARWLRAGIRRALGDLPGAYADFAEAARLYPVKPEYARERDQLASRIRLAGKGGGP